MPKRLRKPKQPKDVNQAAYAMVLRSTGQAEPLPPKLTRTEVLRFMRAMGSKGGKKGGPARAAKMTSEQRSESASKAARAKWAKIRAKNATH
jgi:hypothetical protein